MFYLLDGGDTVADRRHGLHQLANPNSARLGDKCTRQRYEIGSNLNLVNLFFWRPSKAETRCKPTDDRAEHSLHRVLLQIPQPPVPEVLLLLLFAAELRYMHGICMRAASTILERVLRMSPCDQEIAPHSRRLPGFLRLAHSDARNQSHLYAANQLQKFELE
jgi:hypothetical protein